MSYSSALTDLQLRATPVPVSGPLTDVQLRASAVPVSGPLTDAQLRAAAVPVSGTFWQATQPVSGPLTDAQLRAAAVPVSGPLTDAQLRAVAVPVSGTFWQATQPVSIAATVAVSGPLTDAQLRATAVPISGTVKVQSATSVSSVLQTTANTAQAAAISLAAAGAGLFHYITSIVIQRVNNTATAVAADTTVRQITSANFNGWAHEQGSVLAAGAMETFIYNFGDVGIRSAVANTLTSFSLPAGGAGTKFRMTVTYYTGT